MTGAAPPQIASLVERLLDGDRRALSRTITLVENTTAQGRDALRLLYSHTGNAHVIGVTGGSGAGKSTLVGALGAEFRRRGRSVGIVAVDPSSPFTRGALLGDRIRMQELSKDPEVFVRSMATRGELGGLAPTTADVVSVLDAAGKDVILVETVGAGQDEVEVASAADTTLVVVTPGAGDEVQAMKAGIMEVADVLVLNKADLPGADAMLQQLQAMVNLASRGRLDSPIISTVAPKATGVAELADAIDARKEKLEASGAIERLRADRARRQVLAVARQQLLDDMLRRAERYGRLDELMASVAARAVDPYTAAQQLVSRYR